MRYENVVPAIFLERPNRFIARLEIQGREIVAHVKNTGRCAELLLPGAKCYAQLAANPARKTPYDLISVYKGAQLINLDSGAPNRVFAEWVLDGKSPWGDILSIRPEVRKGDSRLDFRLDTADGPIYIETKGVTLEEDGIARFPDAPTERGVKHLKELCRCVREGHRAAAVFILQMKGVRAFSPNDRTHPAFGDALREAAQSGVELLALDCLVTSDTLQVDSQISILL